MAVTDLYYEKGYTAGGKKQYVPEKKDETTEIKLNDNLYSLNKLAEVVIPSEN